MRLLMSGCMMAGVLLTACSGRPAYPVTEHAHVTPIEGILWMSTEMDRDEAERLFKIAIDQGDIRALVNLGYLYERDSDNVLQAPAVQQRQLTAAVRLYRLAAEKGDVMAQTNLGAICIERLPDWAAKVGACHSQSEAAHWFRLAADQSYLKATVYLGYMSEHGLGGLEKDKAEATRLYRLAQERGEELGAVFLYDMEEERKSSERRAGNKDVKP
jgi:TPR repeat protein